MIYGNGSAGNKTISTNTTFDANEYNLQYIDFTIDAGIELKIPSGAIIRCQGIFSNQGTLTVLPSAVGGNYRNNTSDTRDGGARPAHPGVSAGAAGTGGLAGSGLETAIGGTGGIGLQGFSARQLLKPGAYGGGGGAASPQGEGATGGGSVVILAQLGIKNSITGIIRAAQPKEPTYSAGGGGGGWIILASPTEVVNEGMIEAKGGNAYQFSSGSLGAGGGGGGGLVHFVSPNVTLGTVNVTGGLKGATTTRGRSSPANGGGGGGASYGNGGSGSSVTKGISDSNATDGQSGAVFVSQMEPTDLF
jgi:hypothetical protein